MGARSEADLVYNYDMAFPPSVLQSDFTPANLSALDAAISQGVTEVRFQDRTVRYQSVQSMLMVRTLIYNQLYPGDGTTAVPPTRQVRMRSCKGL